MAKAKMPVAKHHSLRTSMRTPQVWTEELTFHKASDILADPSGMDPYAPSGRRSRVGP